MSSVLKMQQCSKQVNIQALLLLLFHINRNGWCGSLVHRVGTGYSVLEGKGAEGLIQGHKVSLGQRWHERAQSSVFLCPYSLVKALTSPPCSFLALAGMQAWQVVGLGVGRRGLLAAGPLG